MEHVHRDRLFERWRHEALLFTETISPAINLEIARNGVIMTSANALDHLAT